MQSIFLPTDRGPGSTFSWEHRLQVPSGSRRHHSPHASEKMSNSFARTACVVLSEESEPWNLFNQIYRVRRNAARLGENVASIHDMPSGRRWMSVVKSKRLMRPRQRKSDDGRLDSTRLDSGSQDSCGLCRPVDLHNQPVSPSSANAQAQAATSEPLVDVWWKRPCAVLAVRPNPCPNLLAGHGPAPQLHQAGFELWMSRYAATRSLGLATSHRRGNSKSGWSSRTARALRCRLISGLWSPWLRRRAMPPAPTLLHVSLHQLGAPGSMLGLLNRYSHLLEPFEPPAYIRELARAVDWSSVALVSLSVESPACFQDTHFLQLLF